MAMRRLGASIILASMIAVTPLSTAGAAPKKPGADPQAAMCAYLLGVMTYPYVNPIIQQTALAMYIGAGCSR